MRLAAFVAVAALAASVGAAAARTAQTELPPLPRIAPACVEADFASARRNVRARLCMSTPSAQRVPAVIVLHGCGGFGTLDQTLAKRLPEHGIATDYVDYFGSTAPPGPQGFCNAHAAVRRAFPTWLRIVRDATRALEHTQGIDPQRVGAIGWSLGGGITLVAAERYPKLFSALVLFSAAAFGPVLREVNRLPPTLVLSGGSGDIVPVSDAIALYHALRLHRVTAELHVYPHGNHQWKHAQFDAGLRWTLAFLGRHL